MEKAELFINAANTLGEGPSWDNERNILYWLDILENKIQIFYSDSNKHKTINIGEYPGCVVPCSNSNDVVVAAKSGIFYLNIDTEEKTFIVNPESDKPENHFNNGICDSKGRLWAGTVHLTDSGVITGDSALYCVQGRNCKKSISNVTASNGTAWNMDNNIMYYIDSYSGSDSGYNEIAAYDYDIETGKIKNKRLVVKDRSSDGSVFDGMTIDEEGMLWVAMFGGSRVCRYNPINGKLINEISVPAPIVTSCTFGGPNLDELYITTGTYSMEPEVLKSNPEIGGVFVFKPGVKGLPVNRFDAE